MSTDTAAAAGSLRQASSKRGGRAFAPPFSLLIPTVVLLVVVVVVPFILGVWVSLTSLNQYTIAHWISAPFIGLSNYITSFGQINAIGASFSQSISVSLSFSILTTLIILPVGVGAALLLNEQFPARGVFRALFLLPYVIPTFVNGIVWRLMFLNGFGLVDQMLSVLHLASKETFWLIGPNAFWALVMADVWATWPFIYLMALAALQGIPSDVYDSATVDGAGPVSSLFRVTLPIIWPTLALAALLSTINHFNNFALPFVMFGTPPPPATDVLPVTVYINSFQVFNFGLGSAMSVLSLRHHPDSSSGVHPRGPVGGKLMAVSKSAGRRITGGVRIVLLALYTLIVVIPLLYMLSISVTQESAIESGSFLPKVLDFSAWHDMWISVNLALYLRNSLVVSTATALLATMFALGGAYVFARFRFRGRTLFGGMLVGVQTVPAQMLLLPVFIIFVIIQNALHVRLIGTYQGLVLTYLTFALPFSIWMLASYISGLPLELEEAGLVDGCSRLSLLRHIVLPLTVPGMVVAFIFSFLLSWNEVLFASVLTSSATKTLGVGLPGYLAAGEAGGAVFWNQLMGASIVSALPAVVLFLLVQRFIVTGLTHGAVKG
ncbi:MAG: ABC transporter permease subunit [Chloroflexi bacterium]|nr:ABC transporter permease subunit [Chloroflexota bacterium]